MSPYLSGIFFLDEFAKLAEEAMALPPQSIEGLSLVRQLPRDNDEAMAQLRTAISQSGTGEILGHKNVIVPENVIGDIKSMGFRPTRIAVPLPGEKPFAVSWRRGDIHLHKAGPVYLAHQDKSPPKGLVSSVRHGVTEGLPALKKRLKEKTNTMLDHIGDEYEELQSNLPRDKSHGF